jgi:hypothetical protein
VALAILTFALFKLSVADVFTLSRGDLGLLLAFGFVGYFMSVVGWRLLTGRGRKADGGLLPPAVVRVGGLLFMLGGVAEAFMNRWAVVGAAGLAILGFTCFALARHRERQASQGWKSDHVA